MAPTGVKWQAHPGTPRDPLGTPVVQEHQGTVYIPYPLRQSAPRYNNNATRLPWCNTRADWIMQGIRNIFLNRIIFLYGPYMHPPENNRFHAISIRRAAQVRGPKRRAAPWEPTPASADRTISGVRVALAKQLRANPAVAKNWTTIHLARGRWSKSSRAWGG